MCVCVFIQWWYICNTKIEENDLAYTPMLLLLCCYILCPAYTFHCELFSQTKEKTKIFFLQQRAYQKKKKEGVAHQKQNIPNLIFYRRYTNTKAWQGQLPNFLPSYYTNAIIIFSLKQLGKCLLLKTIRFCYYTFSYSFTNYFFTKTNVGYFQICYVSCDEYPGMVTPSYVLVCISHYNDEKATSINYSDIFN